MSTPTVTITRDGPLAVPFEYTLAPQEAFEPFSVSAVFHGAGASGPFLACCSFYSQDGSLIARCPTAVPIAAGGSAEVTYAPFLDGRGSGGGLTTLAWGRLTGGGAPQVVAGDPATGNPTLVDFSGGGFSEDGSGTFSFDPLVPEFIQCSATPLPGAWFLQANLTHDNAAPSGIDPSLVRAALRIDAPVGSGDGNISSQTTLGANNGQPIDQDNLYAWGLNGLQPNNAQVAPVGFGILVQNFDAAINDLSITNPLIVVTLIGA